MSIDAPYLETSVPDQDSGHNTGEALPVQRFISALKADDALGAYRAFKVCNEQGMSVRAFQASTELSFISHRCRLKLLAVMVRDGDLIRANPGMNDIELIRGWRALLPSYAGKKPVTLYRGEGADNVRKGTYGVSWTASKEVAISFAQGVWRLGHGGSALIQVEAPPEAIICAPCWYGNRYGEREYVVDRLVLQQLGIEVKVLQRFPQMSQRDLESSNSRPAERREAGEST
jgi:hypothetical protein